MPIAIFLALIGGFWGGYQPWGSSAVGPESQNVHSFMQKGLISLILSLWGAWVLPTHWRVCLTPTTRLKFVLAQEKQVIPILLDADLVRSEGPFEDWNLH